MYALLLSDSSRKQVLLWGRYPQGPIQGLHLWQRPLVPTLHLLKLLTLMSCIWKLNRGVSADHVWLNLSQLGALILVGNGGKVVGVGNGRVTLVKLPCVVHKLRRRLGRHQPLVQILLYTFLYHVTWFRLGIGRGVLILSCRCLISLEKWLVCLLARQKVSCSELGRLARGVRNERLGQLVWKVLSRQILVQRLVQVEQRSRLLCFWVWYIQICSWGSRIEVH